MPASAPPTAVPSSSQGDATRAPDATLIRRFDIAGPRYTSYPTADRFVEGFDAGQYEHWLDHRAAAPVRSPLSLYVHIPFCESVCWYGACNKIGTRDRDRGDVYVEDLLRELSLYTRRIGFGHPVSQMHWGGGTPTFLRAPALRRLMHGLTESLSFTPQAERSIELDPRTIGPADLQGLRELGFNRVSFGVQDFDEQVQQAVHRVQSTRQVFDLVEQARTLGFESVNIDLICGLPRQTLAGFDRTLQTVIALRPDRIALYGYAHLPERFKPQRRIHTADLPPPADKLEMMRSAIGALGGHGYVHIGMDHFALPDDTLAVAQRMGVLHRNFMGYTTQPDCDLIGLGVSAIGRVGPSYAQNHRTLQAWEDAVRHERLPIERGCELSRDDLVRRQVIMSLMCHGSVSWPALSRDWLIEPREVFRDELVRLQEFSAMGLVQLDDDGIRTTAAGRFFVRPMAMVFDRYLRGRLPAGQYSRVL